MQTGEIRVLGLKESIQCVPPARRDTPRAVEVAPEAAGVPPEVPGDLGEAGSKPPLFSLQALRQRLRLGCGVVAEERYDRSELGRHGLGLALLPIDGGVTRNTHLCGPRPLNEAQFSTPRLQVRSQCLWGRSLILL